MLNQYFNILTKEQRSLDWHKIRQNLITATDVPSILECSPFKTKRELLIQKCSPIEDFNYINNKIFNSKAIEWGVKYEPIAKQIYQNLYNCVVDDLGLVGHKNIEWLGASPDGIIYTENKLVELKCLYNRGLSNDVPIHYWIQTQIQMECCNISQCDLFQCKFIEYENEEQYNEDMISKKGIVVFNDKTYYWKLIDYKCITINRDSNWFTNSFPNLLNFRNDISYYKNNLTQLTKSSRKRKIDDNPPNSNKRLCNPYNLRNVRSRVPNQTYLKHNINEWVSATEVRNYILKEPLIDYLNKFGFNKGHVPDIKHEIDFNEFVCNQGINFENAVVEYLFNNYPKYIVKIASQYEGYSITKFEETFNEMVKGTPMIYQAVLHDKILNTYGIADLLIRSDYINYIFPESIPSEIENIKAPNLGTNYHYYVIDIKFSTLTLDKNNEYLLNSGLFPCYKAQICVYNMALGHIQGITPGYGFILGRKHKRMVNKVYEINNNCLNKLGKIDFNDKDKEIINQVSSAVKWIKTLKKYGKDWKLPNYICNILPSHVNNGNDSSFQGLEVLPQIGLPKELLPNMVNKYDHPWHSFKIDFANTLGDITSLWSCGYKNRQLAFNKGIYSWRNPLCNSQILGFKGKRATIIDGILKVNRDNNIKIYYQDIKPLTDFISYKDANSLKLPENHPRDKLEFFVDFETVNDLDDDFKEIPYTNGNERVFMIGLGWISPESNSWRYKSFVVDNLDKNSEKENFEHWLRYMKYIKNFSIGKDKPFPRIYHWGDAEQVWYKKAFNRLELPKEFSNLEWTDLLKNIKENPIFVKGALNFGLKSYARALYNNGLIKSNWEDNNMDGIGAMVSAWKSQTRARNLDISFKQMPIIKEISRYNEIDCKVLVEIVKFIRRLKK